MSSALLVLLTLVLPGNAAAQVPCPEGAIACDRQDVNFSYTDAAFEEFSWSTGWVPTTPVADWANVQVRLSAGLAASTTIEMGGETVTSWPDALSVAVLGRSETGRLIANYGPTLTAEYRASLSFSILGDYDFSGTIPLPTDFITDLTINSTRIFDPFVLPGEMPRPIQFVETAGPISVTPLSVGASGISLSFTISATADFSIGYETVDIEVRPSMSRILMGDAAVLVSPATEMGGFGAFQDLVIVPNGWLTYETSINFVASVGLSTPVGDWSWDLGSYSIPVTSETNETAFNEEMVHVALPDLTVDTSELNFGELEPTQAVTQMLQITNNGERELRLSTAIAEGPFLAQAGNFIIDPGATLPLNVSFQPTDEGTFMGTLMLTSNDPDTPSMVISLNGASQLPPPPPVIDAGPEIPYDASMGVSDAGIMPPPTMDGGCGCRVERGSMKPQTAALGLLAFIGIVWRLRRRR